MRFAIAIPQFSSDGEFDPAAFRAYFARAEELGFDVRSPAGPTIHSWLESMNAAISATGPGAPRVVPVKDPY